MNEAGRCDDAPRTLASTTRKEAVVAADTSGEHSLADQVESLAQQLAAVRTEVASLARMADEVSRLADRVAELAALRSAGTGATAPMSWFNLNAEQATADLVELTRWVYSVLLHYSVVSQQLTDCWRRHPSAVEGLLALRAAWYAAYRRPGARPETAVDWHIRLLPGVADLLREELRACSESNHAPGGEIERYRRSRPRVLPDEEHVRGYAVWWAATRGVGPDPEVS